MRRRAYVCPKKPPPSNAVLLECRPPPARTFDGKISAFFRMSLTSLFSFRFRKKGTTQTRHKFDTQVVAKSSKALPITMKFAVASIAAVVGLLVVAAPSPVLSFAPTATTTVGRISSSSTTATNSALFAFVNTAEKADRNVGPFDQWATQCGVQRVEGFQLNTEDGRDWSVITTKDLPANSPVLAVPEGMIMSSTKSKRNLEGMSNGGVQAAVEQLGRMGAGLSIPKFYLFLQILLEFQNGDNSPYFPWLDMLPRLYFNSVSMTDFCYECLPPLVFSLTREEKVKFDNFYEVLQKVDIISPQLKESKDICKWAFNAMNTRCVGQPGQEQKIVPMGDMVRMSSNLCWTCTDNMAVVIYDDAPM